MDVVEVVSVGSRWRLVSNRKATERLYLDKPPGMADRCGCKFCQNYRQAWPLLPPPFVDLVSCLGIDPKKERSLSVGEFVGSVPVYSGAFVLVAELAAGKDSHEPLPSGTGYRIRHAAYVPGVELGFHAIRRAPNPLLEMRFQIEVPWVLGEDIRKVPTYLHGLKVDPPDSIFA